MKSKEVVLFSVIIPTYNRSDLISRTINSILKSDYSNYEIIIVDDGSTDDTKAIVAPFLSNKKIQYYEKQNGERGAARNFGARQAKGNYLNFFDSDDLMYSNHLLTAYEFAINNQNPEIFHVGYEIIDQNGQSVLQETNFNYDIKKRLIKTNFLGCNSVFVRKDIFSQNTFNEDRVLSSSEDWEIWLRYAARFNILSCNAITFAIKNHAGRSLFNIETDKVINRDNALMSYLLKDQKFCSSFAANLSLFIADRFTFYALLLSLERKKQKALFFLVKAMKSTVKVLTRRRFWASFKLIIIK